MTRKDYVLIAAAINSASNKAASKTLEHYEGVNLVRDAIIKVLKDDNPLFDAARFTQACKA